jgi:NTE family protein
MTADRLATTLILGGGLGLGAYQAGVVAALERSGRLELEAVGGSSIGAINAAILAGNAPEQRVRQLEAFWRSVEAEVAPAPLVDPFGLARSGPVRRALNWTNVSGAHLVGAPALFSPALGGLVDGDAPALYSTRPLLDRFAERIDFDRLNGGPLRYVLAATDVESGATAVFDTARGDRITPDHLLASGGLLPSFPAVRIDGRLLADGGFSANAPLEPFLSSERPRPSSPLCVVADLFSPDGPAPRTLEDAAHRANDLKYACQTRLRLQGLQRERALEARLAGRDADGGVDLLYLSYRAEADEAGPEKPFDLSSATLADRRRAGEADAQAALARLDELSLPGSPGLRVHPVRRTAA